MRDYMPKFYTLEDMTQDDLNKLALERNNFAKEIERLNKELQNLEKLNNANYQSFIEVNNIINEIEKWCNERIYDDDQLYEQVLDKLQELKGEDKECK